MSGSAGLAVYKLAFQISPIMLVNGIVGLMPGAMLPLISFTESLNFALGVLGGSGPTASLDDFFAQFMPLPGATLVDNQVGTYPFANQAVAANAIIAQPLSVSLLMMIPVRQTAGYASKLAIMMALKATLDQHNNLGGTYTVITPSFFYTDCILTKMTDVSRSDSKQPQNAWQLDFTRPLVTAASAQGALGALMTKISAGVPIDGQPAWSGLGNTVGIPPSGATPSLVPASSGLPGAGPLPTATSIGGLG